MWINRSQDGSSVGELGWEWKSVKLSRNRNVDQAFRTLLFVPQKILLLPTIRHFDFRNFLGNQSEVYECWPFKNCKIPRCGSWAGYNGLYGEAPPEWSSLRSWRYCVGARLKFWWGSRVPKKGSRNEAVFLAASPLVTAPSSNFTRLYYNGSVAKSHSTTTHMPPATQARMEYRCQASDIWKGWDFTSWGIGNGREICRFSL